MLAVKPAKHERRPQHDIVHAARQDHVLLLFLRLCVIVICLGFQNRGTDVDDVWHLEFFYRLQHIPSGCHRVPDIGFPFFGPDLRLQHDHGIHPFKVLGPRPWCSEISPLRCDVGVHLLQDTQIMSMFIEHHNVGVPLGLESGDEVLTDKACATWEDDFLFEDMCDSTRGYFWRVPSS